MKDLNAVNVEKEILKEKIKKHRENRKKAKNNYKNLKVIKPTKKVVEALALPKVLNLNPRSIYNKRNEFETFVKEEAIQLICMSESWEREEESLENVIEIEGYKVLSNVHQRKGKGGRPAIIVNTQKYEVENLTNTIINIPWGIEIVWAVLTPKNNQNTWDVKKFVVASVYCKPNSKKKTLLLDHIAQVYNLLSSKYKKGLHWLICGDTNDLRLDPILALSPNLQQVVQHYTRLNPPRILDPIITTMARYYQDPQVLPPLDPDQNSNGKPSDHMMVVFTPINVINTKSTNAVKQIKFRPLSENGIEQMESWLKNENWSEIINQDCVNLKANILQDLLMSKCDEFFPEKVRTISSRDQPFFTNKLKQLRRRKSREYHKHRKSLKWEKLEQIYQIELSKSKRNFYRRRIQTLKKGNPGKWYSELKKITNFDQLKSEEILVENIKDLTALEQTEQIADKFSEVANEYEKLKAEDIAVPFFSEEEIPKFTTKEVELVLNEIDAKKSNVNGDFPVKLLKKFSKYLAVPIRDLLNCSIRQGIWPEIFKMEIVTLCRSNIHLKVLNILEISVVY